MKRFTYPVDGEEAMSDELPLVGLSGVLVGLLEVSAVVPGELVVGGSIVGLGALVVEAGFSVVAPVVVSERVDEDIVV
jgi:hypothetical protein